MKLSKTYYEQINEAIARLEVSQQSFSFTKKRGWIYINYLPAGSYFSFFRKKTVEISSQNHQWENKETFKIKLSGGSIEEKGSWESVMKSLTDWLKSI